MKMDGQVELTNPVETSIGGMRGHVLRRGIHLSMSFLPFIYFAYGEDVANAVGVSLDRLVASIVLVALAGEGLRLRFGWTVFGQRDYEAHQISALAWGAFGVGMVFLLAPTEAYAWPLILSLSLGDPLMGELRRKDMEARQVMIASTFALLLVWLGAWYLFGTPLWMAVLLAPVCMIAEWPRLRYIDDNATMVLIPLALVIILEPFAGVMS
jgi:hypothetical protein